MTAAATSILTEVTPDVSTAKDIGITSDVQLLLPDPKKRVKQTKQIFVDKGWSSHFVSSDTTLTLHQAFEKTKAIKNAFQLNPPILAIDVPQAHLEAMLRTSTWISDEEAWKALNVTHPNPPGYPGYNYSIREAVQKRKSEGYPFILLYSIREDRVQLLSLN